MRGAETIYLLRFGPPDRFGERTPLPEIQIDGCIIWPHTSTPDVGEDNLRGPFVLSGVNLWIPEDVLVLATDRIRLRDQMYEVDGEPGTYVTTGGRHIGVLVVCKRVGVPVAG